MRLPRPANISHSAWNNTNRVVSNRVVSKGPLYPSNTKTVTLLMFAGWNIPAQSNYRHIFLGPVLAPIRKSGFWEQPRLIRPRLYASDLLGGWLAAEDGDKLLERHLHLCLYVVICIVCSFVQYLVGLFVAGISGFIVVERHLHLSGGLPVHVSFLLIVICVL